MKRPTRIVSLGFAFVLLGLFAISTSPFAQVKTLEEMMQEVEAEKAESLSENEPEVREEVPERAEEPGRVKTLEEMMQEVDGTSASGSTGTTIEAPTLAAPKSAPASPRPPPEDESNFWFIFGLIALIVTMIMLGVPLYVLIGSLTMYLLFFGGIFAELTLLTSVIEQTRGLSDQTVLLAIPFFVLAGALMTEGDIAQRLIGFAQTIFGDLPGGMGIATVFACAFFAAISGSSPVTVIAIGSIMYPALIKNGFPERFSCGIVTTGGSLGILIPPSIMLVIYAIVDPTALRDPIGYNLAGAGGGESSVKDLFIAGLIPGAMIGGVLALYAMYIGMKMNPLNRERAIRAGVVLFFVVGIPAWLFVRLFTNNLTIVEGVIIAVVYLVISFKLYKAIKTAFWALCLPLIILGGIYSGVFTPTQAAAVSVLYAVLVEFFIHRSLKVSDLPRILSESAVLMGTLLIIMALALGFNLYLDRAKIPEQAVAWILEMDLSIITFLLIVNVLLIVVGFFMDIISAILILVPLLAPIAHGLGIHPIHMAIIFIVNLEIGYLSPPIGLNLFVASALFKKGLNDVVRSVVPFIGLMLCCLMLVTYVPSISLGLVSWSKGGDFYVTFPTTNPSELDDIAAEEGAPGAAPVVEEAPAPAGVKTLDELMREIEDGASPPAAEERPPDRVKTLEELMREVEQDNTADDPQPGD
ncbi:MAG: TRAP transporter large permease [Bradymonadaceae bacterium]